MRILISGSTGQSMPPPFAGTCKVSLLYARTFREMGHEVAVTWVYRPPNSDDLGANARYFFEYGSKPNKFNKALFFLLYFLRNPVLYADLFRSYWNVYPKLSTELILYAAYGVWIDTVIASFQPDIITCQAALIKTFMVAKVAQRRGIPVVYEPYAEIHAQDMGINKNLTKDGQKKFWQPFLNMADMVIGMDNCSVGALNYLPPEKVKVFYDTCDYEAYQVTLPETKEELRDSLGLPRELFLVGQVGAFEWRKGHDHLIRAVGILTRQGYNIGAAICGGPGDYEKWKVIAREEGVEDKIFFFRNFSERQLARLHKSLDLYANLSHLSRSCGLDLALLEAMSAGLPIVVYDHGALKNAVPKGENGAVVPAENIPALAEAIASIYAMQPAERARMGGASRKFASALDVRDMSKIKIGWFTEIINNSRRTVSVVTFANLGEKENLKTVDIQPVIDLFAEKGMLKQIICQVHKHFYFRNIASAFPSFVRYPLRLIEKISGIGLSRAQTDDLFDFFASRRLERADAVLFYPAQFEKTIAVAKKQGSLVIGLAETAHYSFNKQLNEEESAILGIPAGDYAGVMRKEGAAEVFNYIIAISDFLKRSFVHAGYPAERIFVATPDINANRFTQGPPAPSLRLAGKASDKFQVLYVAYTTPLKGLHYLLDAWDNLKLPDAELVLVGGYGSIPEELKRRYDTRIHANPTIRWVGKTRNPEEYYRRASAFVLPSLTEGNPHVVMEAMASGLPVITTENAAGLVEDGTSGFVVPIRDSDAIRAKIAYLYHHPDEAKEMGRKARESIERKKPFGEAIFDIYQEIMRRERTPLL
ncbi:MAG: glycosyltransferase family 4 protein [bacterium]|nr:glycosyltransferase family 4 protein [bacterium]